MRVILCFEATQVKALNAITGEQIAVGDYLKVMRLLYMINAVVVQ